MYEYMLWQYGGMYYYMVLVIPAVLFSLWAQWKVNSTYKKYSQYGTYSRMTGYEAARRILDANGLRHIAIERISGNLTDHYDPQANVIRLSDGVRSSTSIRAIGVAAHEAGHAVQYAVHYFPIKVRTAIIPVCQIGSNLSFPLLILGLVLSSSSLINLGLILFALVALFQFVTLPVEFNASGRAVDILAMSGIVNENEIVGVKKVLRAAAMTYVAALAVSLANLLRLILMFGGRRRK